MIDYPGGCLLSGTKFPKVSVMLGFAHAMNLIGCPISTHPHAPQPPPKPHILLGSKQLCMQTNIIFLVVSCHFTPIFVYIYIYVCVCVCVCGCGCVWGVYIYIYRYMCVCMSSEVWVLLVLGVPLQ